MDVGFSSCTGPTYCPMSEYFGLRAKIKVLMLKDIQQGKGVMQGNTKVFWVWGFSIWLNVLRGARVVHIRF